MQSSPEDEIVRSENLFPTSHADKCEETSD